MPIRVLVAEDNAISREIAVCLLERAGHDAVVVEDGGEALAALEREAFDAVLMDVEMPALDGFQVTAAIRERERATGMHVPIVAVTAHATQEDAARCLAAGMDAYLAKPLQSRELLTVIDGLLSGRPHAPVTALAPTAGEVVDEALLLERVGGDRQAVARLARLFLGDAPKLLARIRRAIASDDASSLRAAAHALKGAAANFAAPAATEAAARLQQIGASGELGQSHAALSQLETELARLREALSRVSRGT